MAPFRLVALAVFLASFATARADFPGPARPFVIEIVDDQTNRGVPLVELETVDRVRYFTDSAGLVAIDDPVLLGQKAFFTIDVKPGVLALCTIRKRPAPDCGRTACGHIVRPHPCVATRATSYHGLLHLWPKLACRGR